MKELLLTRRVKTYLDDEAWSVLKDYSWMAQRAYTWLKDKRCYLACRRVHIDGCRVDIFLHRQVMGVPKPFLIRHKSVGYLDNQHNSLQIEDAGGRFYHFRRFSDQSQFTGVFWDRYYGLWRAEFHKLVIGYYPVEVDAARAYNIKIKEVYGNVQRRMNTIRIMREYNRKNAGVISKA